MEQESEDIRFGSWLRRSWSSVTLNSLACKSTWTEKAWVTQSMGVTVYKLKPFWIFNHISFTYLLILTELFFTKIV